MSKSRWIKFQETITQGGGFKEYSLPAFISANTLYKLHINLDDSSYTEKRRQAVIDLIARLNQEHSPSRQPILGAYKYVQMDEKTFETHIDNLKFQYLKAVKGENKVEIARLRDKIKDSEWLQLIGQADQKQLDQHINACGKAVESQKRLIGGAQFTLYFNTFLTYPEGPKTAEHQRRLKAFLHDLTDGLAALGLAAGRMPETDSCIDGFLSFRQEKLADKIYIGHDADQKTLATLKEEQEKSQLFLFIKKSLSELLEKKGSLDQPSQLDQKEKKESKEEDEEEKFEKDTMIIAPEKKPPPLSGREYDQTQKVVSRSVKLASATTGLGAGLYLGILFAPVTLGASIPIGVIGGAVLGYLFGEVLGERVSRKEKNTRLKTAAGGFVTGGVIGLGIGAVLAPFTFGLSLIIGPIVGSLCGAGIGHLAAKKAGNVDAQAATSQNSVAKTNSDITAAQTPPTTSSAAFVARIIPSDLTQREVKTDAKALAPLLIDKMNITQLFTDVIDLKIEESKMPFDNPWLVRLHQLVHTLSHHIAEDKDYKEASKNLRGERNTMIYFWILAEKTNLPLRKLKQVESNLRIMTAYLEQKADNNTHAAIISDMSAMRDGIHSYIKQSKGEITERELRIPAMTTVIDKLISKNPVKDSRNLEGSRDKIDTQNPLQAPHATQRR